MDKRALRELVVRARVYKIMSTVFAVCGLILFVFLYVKYIEANVASAFHNPFVVLILILPFLPAAVLSFLSSKAEKKVAAMRGTKGDAGPAAASKAEPTSPPTPPKA